MHQVVQYRFSKLGIALPIFDRLQILRGRLKVIDMKQITICATQSDSCEGVTATPTEARRVGVGNSRLTHCRYRKSGADCLEYITRRRNQ